MGFIWRGWGLFGPVARPTRGAITADCLVVAMAMVSTQGCGAMWRLSHGHVAPPPPCPLGWHCSPPDTRGGAQGGGWGCPQRAGGTPRPAGGSPKGAGKDLGRVGQWGHGVVDMRVQGAWCSGCMRSGSRHSRHNQSRSPQSRALGGLGPQARARAAGRHGARGWFGAGIPLVPGGSPVAGGQAMQGSSPSHRVGPRPASSRRAGPRRRRAPAD